MLFGYFLYRKDQEQLANQILLRRKFPLKDNNTPAHQNSNMANEFCFKVDSKQVFRQRIETIFDLFDEKSLFVKIGEDGPSFIPTCMKVVNITGPTTLFEKGFEDYTEPGLYLTQDGFIICYLKNNSKTNFLHFKTVSLDSNGKYS